MNSQSHAFLPLPWWHKTGNLLPRYIATAHISSKRNLTHRKIVLQLNASSGSLLKCTPTVCVPCVSILLRTRILAWLNWHVPSVPIRESEHSSPLGSPSWLFRHCTHASRNVAHKVVSGQCTNPSSTIVPYKFWGKRDMNEGWFVEKTG